MILYDKANFMVKLLKTFFLNFNLSSDVFWKGHENDSNGAAAAAADGECIIWKYCIYIYCILCLYNIFPAYEYIEYK